MPRLLTISLSFGISLPALAIGTAAATPVSAPLPPPMVYAAKTAATASPANGYTVDNVSSENHAPPASAAENQAAPAGPAARSAAPAQVISAETIRRELCSAGVALPETLELNDRHFVLPSQQWLVQTYLPYIRHLLSSLRIHPQGEGFDCDNYSVLFRAQLALSNWEAGQTVAGDIPCGLMKVRQVHSFGGVPGSPDAYHSLTLLRTNRGWFVVEPQNGAICPLQDYPNRKGIVFIYF